MAADRIDRRLEHAGDAPVRISSQDPRVSMPPTDEQWDRTPPARGPDSGPGPARDDRPSRPLWQMLAATALVATVLGAGVGTAMTLLIGEPGPSGPRGERGPVGPDGDSGPQGPAADTSDIEFSIDDLSGEVADLQTRIEELESGTSSVSEDDIAELDGRIADLEGLISDLCFELDLIC